MSRNNDGETLQYVWKTYDGDSLLWIFCNFERTGWCTIDFKDYLNFCRLFIRNVIMLVYSVVTSDIDTKESWNDSMIQ